VIVCLAGNPSIDRLFEVDRIRMGDIHWPGAFVALPGGKGLHVAQVTAALGSRAAATGILAGHAGRWIAETLAAEGVDGRFAWGPGETRSCLSVADRSTGQLTEFYEAGTPAGEPEWLALREIVLSLLDGARWLALSGSLPPQTPADGYAQLIAAAREAGVAAAVDSRGRWLAQAIGAGPELVKINAFEARELLGAPIDDLPQARRAADAIRARAGGDGHAVAITMGEAGMVLVDPGGRAWQGSTPARGSYPVGSGDAFLAGMLVGLGAGASWPEATRLALGAAAANAEVPGAARLDPDRARALAAASQVAAL
jgi:1-phosphofructokinase family hexose kinase